MTDTTEHTHRIVKIAQEAVKAGRVTKEEANAFLTAKYNVTLDSYKKTNGTAIAFALVLFAFVGIGFIVFFPSSPAGLLTLHLNSTIGANGTTLYPVVPLITGLNLSGVLSGDGNATIWFDTPQGSLLIGTVLSDTGAPRTDKPSYAVGEAINIEHAPLDASYYFDDGTNSATVGIPFNATVNGTLLIVANESGNLATYRLAVIIGDVSRTTAFNNLCDQTCAMNETNGTIRVETTSGAAITLTAADASSNANRPPELTVAFNTVTDATVINLSEHFIDPDGDELFFSVGSSDLVNATVNGSLLTITPVATGSGSLPVYASDLKNLTVASIPLSIVVSAPPSDNGTANSTSVINTTETNPLDNTTSSTNGTNETTPATLDCGNSNPNLRPAECFIANPDAYSEQDVYWQNLDRTPVAKFTIIGNLLIKGTVVEHATGQPGARDFRLGNVDQDGNTNAAIWIGADGNLYLRGSLHEENTHIVPPPGSYSLLTKRSLYLAYADLSTGDLYIRGDAIPYRREI